MNEIKSILILFFTLFTLSILAQPNTTFLEYYPFEGADTQFIQSKWTSNIIYDLDGNFLLQGNSQNSYWGLIVNRPQYIQITTEGEFVNRPWVECEHEFNVRSIVTTENGYYAAIEYSGGPLEINSLNPLVFINSNFDLNYQIELNFPDTLYSDITSIVKKDSLYLITGYLTDPSVTPSWRYSCAWMMNSDEEVIWTAITDVVGSVRGLFFDGLFSSDGGVLVFGKRRTCKIDSLGNIEWVQDHIADSHETVDIIEFEPNVYVKMFAVDEHLDDNNNYVRLIKFTDNYTVLDSIDLDLDPNYIHSSLVERNGNLLKTNDGNIILAFSTEEGELHKYDTDFNLIWQRNLFLNDDSIHHNYAIGNGNHPIMQLENNDLLFCASDGNGWYNKPFALVRTNSNGEIVSIDGESIVTSNELILEAYPNPFNPETRITFELKKQADITLEIINIKGQKVKTVTNESFDKGKHSVVWNGRNYLDSPVSSGIYFIILKSDNQIISSKKITLIK